MVIVSERFVGAQRLFELAQRKARVGGYESARRIDGFEHDFAAAAAPNPVTEDAQQIVGLRRTRT